MPQQPPPAAPGYPGTEPTTVFPTLSPPVPPGAPMPPPKKNNTGMILGIVGGVLALCLIGGCLIGGGYYFFVGKKNPVAHSTAAPSLPDYPYPSDTYSPSPDAVPTTEEAPPPSPVDVGDCISVNEEGDYLGVGNCNGSRGTYRVLSTDYSQGTCSDPESPYITVDGYRLCLELYLVRNYCYKFPKGSGWVVGASACKAKGTVHVIDIVPGASNGDRCTRDYKWNHWYRFTHPTVVYCVMQY
jgi:hypothetical protein